MTRKTKAKTQTQDTTEGVTVTFNSTGGPAERYRLLDELDKLYNRVCPICGDKFATRFIKRKYCDGERCAAELYRRGRLKYILTKDPAYNGKYAHGAFGLDLDTLPERPVPPRPESEQRRQGAPRKYATEEERKEARRRQVLESYYRRKAREQEGNNES